MATPLPYAKANAKKRDEAAKKMLEALAMHTDLNYTEICAEMEEVVRLQHLPALERDILQFSVKFKENGPLKGTEHCVTTALMPLRYDMRFLQAELVQPRMMLHLIEDEDVRAKMRKIYETIFIFHAIMMDPMPEMSPIRVSDEEFNQALADRAALFTREQYEELLLKVPNFGAIRALAETNQKLIGETIVRVNEQLQSRRCSHCNREKASRCTGCVMRKFCSRECQRAGAHDETCPVTAKRSAASAPAEATKSTD